MTQTKFTKGPWQVWGDWAIKDCTPAENLIATFEHHDQDTDAAFANAHVMAAATAMYRFIEGLQLSVAGEVERDELLKKARGE